VRQRIGLVCTLLLIAACARPRVVFPAGVGEPVADTLQVWSAATDACKGAQSFNAEIHGKGDVADQGLGHFTLHGAMTRKGEIRLEAVAPAGPAIFIVAGRTERATLTMPREQRVVVAPAADIVEALIGLKLAPDDWLDILSGCISSMHPGEGLRFKDVMIVPLERNAGRLRLDRNGVGWRIVAGERGSLLVEYEEFLGRWPSVVQLTSRPGAPVNVRVNITISQVNVNTDLPAAAFVPNVPATYTPMSLGELRAMGPLGR